MGLPSAWIKTTPIDKQASFETVIRNSTIALHRLYEICEEMEDDLNRAETKLDDFSGPNWALRQAYRNGDRSRIRKFKELLSFIQGDLS